MSDQEVAKRALTSHLDFFVKPIFIDGDYPEVVKSQIASMSKKQGYPSSRLSEFTEEEKRMTKGTADLFAVQYYSSRLVKYWENDKGERGVLQHVEMDIFPDSAWISVDWVYVVPWGIQKLLKYIKDTYNNPVIYITENGFPQGDPTSLGSISDRHCRNCSNLSSLIKSTFNCIAHGLFWITLSGTRVTACGLVSSTLILKTRVDPESLTRQPRSMPRSLEIMS